MIATTDAVDKIQGESRRDIITRHRTASLSLVCIDKFPVAAVYAVVLVGDGGHLTKLDEPFGHLVTVVIALVFAPLPRPPGERNQVANITAMDTLPLLAYSVAPMLCEKIVDEIGNPMCANI